MYVSVTCTLVRGPPHMVLFLLRHNGRVCFGRSQKPHQSIYYFKIKGNCSLKAVSFRSDSETRNWRLFVTMNCGLFFAIHDHCIHCKLISESSHSHAGCSLHSLNGEPSFLQHSQTVGEQVLCGECYIIFLARISVFVLHFACLSLHTVWDLFLSLIFFPSS